MDEQTELDLELLASVRRIQSQCLRPGCSRPRVGTETMMGLHDPDSYCDQHGDAL